MGPEHITVDLGSFGHEYFFIITVQNLEIYYGFVEFQLKIKLKWTQLNFEPKENKINFTARLFVVKINVLEGWVIG